MSRNREDIEIKIKTETLRLTIPLATVCCGCVSGSGSNPPAIQDAGGTCAWCHQTGLHITDQGHEILKLIALSKETIYV